MYKKNIKILLFILVFSFPYTIMANNNEVKICDDKGEWAPFSYYQRINGVADKTKLTGAVTELVKDIFKIVDLPYSIDMIPWKRCTSLVDTYNKTKKYEMFINGAYSKERASKYLLSNVIYSTHIAIFYSSKKYPNGIATDSSFNINKYKVCNVHGWDTDIYYEKFNLNKKIKIDEGSKTIDSVLKKIVRNRCDIIITSKEPVYGGEMVGKYTIPKDIKSDNISDSKAQNFYMFLAKTTPRAEELLSKINKAITILRNNGTYDKIFDKYLPKD